MWRLAVLATAAGLLAPAGAAAQGPPYGIPPDNPFVNTPGARGEVYVYGMRNPYRWSFDRLTGNMIIGDVGGTEEEVTFLPRDSIAGADLGWNCRSGSVAGPGNCDPPSDVAPGHTFPSAGAGSGVVVGGYVVRAPDMPAFQGRYIYGDYSNGDLYWLDPAAPANRELAGIHVDQVSSFGEDGIGQLYATSLTGSVVRLNQSVNSLGAFSIGNFDQPVAVAGVAGDPSRVFIVEKPGVVKLRTGTVVHDFLDITSRVGDTGFEEGLLAFATAPDYATSGRVFAFYTDNNGDLQLDEYARTLTEPDRSDPSTRRPLLTIPHQPADNHNGGQLLFGPDGHLHLSTGDGGVQGDPEGDARNLGSLLGKILRIDVGTGAAPQPTPPPDETGPALRTKVKRFQRVLRLGGVVVYVRCNEPCTVALRGRLRIGRASYRMRRAAGPAQVRRRARFKVRLSRKGRRALRRAVRRGKVRRASVRIAVRATDVAGNRSTLVRHRVRVRR